MKITSKGLTYKINFLSFCPPLYFCVTTETIGVITYQYTSTGPVTIRQLGRGQQGDDEQQQS